jgi:DNA polymerase-3 subunit epsilon
VYTVVDIETTGNGMHGNRITEIALYNVDGNRITDSFSSLVNPGCPVPDYITGLTGISTAMVRQAPEFCELADRINAFCQNRIFVAHSVNFDYPIVREEFARCGINFQRKKLCTVRLSRKAFPGLASYSLGKLCNSLNIPLQDRHRAGGDAHATALLLLRILKEEQGPSVIDSFLNVRSQEGTLPPHLPKSYFNRLPEAPGIYYFKDKKGKMLYIGKAINLKKRVLGHFYDTSHKERALCRETAIIDFDLSGSELLALLMETDAIKKYFPPYNRAQKNLRPSFGLFSYQDRDGIIHLAVNRTRKGQPCERVFYNISDAREFLESLCTSFRLCSKYCHLQEGVQTCNHFRVPQCPGVCRGTEVISDYNSRVTEALISLKQKTEHALIRLSGRREEENGLVWIAQGQYKGYGFVPSNFTPASVPELQGRILPQTNHPESERILTLYRLKNPEEVTFLKGDSDYEVTGLFGN